MTNTSIINVTARDKRKLDIKIQVSYKTNLNEAKGILEHLLQEDPCVLSQEEMQVFVDELAADGITLGMRAWVKTEDYWPTRWRLNEKLKNTLEEAGIEIPYPQLDVHIKGE